MEKVQAEIAIQKNRKKAAFRKQILKDRNALLPEQRQMWDQQILQYLIEYDQKDPCPVYLCYVSYKSEVSTKEFICWCLDQGKQIFVPKVLTDKYPKAERKCVSYHKAEEAHLEMEFYQITAWEELKEGYQGILEPQDKPEKSFFAQFGKSMTPERMHLLCFRMLLPGAVFDKTGNRIGYGGGFYDRWLARWNSFQETSANQKDFGHSPAVTLEKIGLAYEMQIVDNIPAEVFDQKADRIITEENVMDNIREDKDDT